MTETAVCAYADLILRTVSLSEGQCLYVKAEPGHWEFVNVLAERAYASGAKYVAVAADHAGLHRARVEYSRGEFLSYVPTYRRDANNLMLDESWAIVSIKSPDDPDALAGIDAQRNGIVQKAIAELDYPFRRAVNADRLRWIVVAVPTPAWAAKVLGTEASRDAADRLWEAMVPILRLDADDPVAAWDEQAARLARRREALDALALTVVRFVGPGTDLRVGLCAESTWVGGASVAGDGRSFTPNLPTEEVFTTPDFRAIYRSGLVFYNTLYDENAASHIALGSSYPKCIRGGDALSPEQYREAGGNTSTVHTDFMIGSPEVAVIGITRDGDEVPIISDGVFRV